MKAKSARSFKLARSGGVLQSDYRETIALVEIDQPRCTRTYGVAPCMAALGVTGEKKCFNTRKTCQDAANYSPVDITLTFGREQLELSRYYGFVIPSLLNLSTTPGQINLGGMDKSASALGQREVVTISLQDHRYSDLVVDPYRLERTLGVAMPPATSGAAVGGAAASLTLDGGASSVDGEYAGMLLGLVSGAGSVQSQEITSYNGTTKVATVTSNWRQNYLKRSNDLAQPDWGKTGCTASAHPEGTLIETTSATDPQVAQNVALNPASRTFRWAIDLKAGDAATVGKQVQLYLYRNSPFGSVFSLSVNLAAEWARYVVTGTMDAVAATVVVGRIDPPQTPVGVVGDKVLARRAQLSEIVTDYIETGAAGIFAPAAGTGYEVREGYKPTESGTFWGKWLARNPYHQGYPLRVLEGDHGDPRSALRVRHYTVERIEGPTNGEVTLTAKDRFTLIESQRAVAPKPSEGELLADILAAATTATLNPVGVGATYPGSGHVALGEEICAFTRAGDVLTLTRAQFGTKAEDHKAEDLVQLVLSYVTQSPHNIIYDLLVTYSTLDASYIDKPAWDEQGASAPDVYTTRICEPTPVAELIGEICEQAGLSVWHDPATDMIELRALRAAEASPNVTDRDWIIDKSLSVMRQDDRRVSEVWVYYGQRNPMLSLDDSQNFHSRLLDVDLPAEDVTQYGVPEIRRVFSRWIPQFGRSAAQRTAKRLLGMFRDPPLEATFRIDASRDGELALARYFSLTTADVQDDTGAPSTVSMACVRLGRGETEISINGQSVRFTEDEAPGAPRTIYIEDDTLNLNLRDVHDSLFAPPVDGVPLTVNVVIESGVYVYSDTVTLPALTTGGWPVDVTLTLENRGFIMGRGGDGANANGIQQAAQPGGNAIELGHPLTIDNTSGYILGGGGGGGGATVMPGFNGGAPGPFIVGGGGGAGGGRGGSSNDGQGMQPGGLGGLPGLKGADGVAVGGYQANCSAGGGGRKAVGTGGVGAFTFDTGAAPTKAFGGECGGGGGANCDEGDTHGGTGGTNLTDGGNAFREGGTNEYAGGGGGGWGMAGGNAVAEWFGATFYPGMGPGKAIALLGKVLTWLGSAPSQTSPFVRGAVS